jgi:hypothetical protein
MHALAHPTPGFRFAEPVRLQDLENTMAADLINRLIPDHREDISLHGVDPLLPVFRVFPGGIVLCEHLACCVDKGRRPVLSLAIALGAGIAPFLGDLSKAARFFPSIGKGCALHRSEPDHFGLSGDHDPQGPGF